MTSAQVRMRTYAARSIVAVGCMSLMPISKAHPVRQPVKIRHEEEMGPLPNRDKRAA